MGRFEEREKRYCESYRDQLAALGRVRKRGRVGRGHQRRDGSKYSIPAALNGRESSISTGEKTENFGGRAIEFRAVASHSVSPPTRIACVCVCVLFYTRISSSSLPSAPHCADRAHPTPRQRASDGQETGLAIARRAVARRVTVAISDECRAWDDEDHDLLTEAELPATREIHAQIRIL